MTFSRSSLTLCAIGGLLTLAACSADSTGPAVPEPNFAKAASSTDPTATWMLPLADADLALASDRQFSDGVYSVYANGTCNVTATIFATRQGSSGDAVVQTNGPGKGKSCSRSFILRYPDGVAETVRSFNNLRMLQNSETVIPVGATVRRVLILNPGAMGVSRCDRVLFGVGDNPLNGAGSDSVSVTRESARRWRVQSDPQSSRLAWCQKTGELFVMPVDFVIVASRDLPT